MAPRKRFFTKDDNQQLPQFQKKVQESKKFRLESKHIVFLAIGLCKFFSISSLSFLMMLTVSTFLQEIVYLSTGYMTLWRDHFGTARFVLALYGVAHFVAGLFWSEPFWREFHENYFLLLFSIFFLIYKNYCFSIFFFFINSRRFFVYFNKFLSTLHKKIQVQTHRYCFFI